MKRTFVIAAALLMCLRILIGSAFAIEIQERIDYEDGSYAIITTAYNSLTRAVSDGNKTYTYYNASLQKCFSYTLYATFIYNGTTSSADDIDFEIHIYRQGWDISTHNEYTSGSTAYGSAAFTGPDDQPHSLSISLTCDKDGNVT